MKHILDYIEEECEGCVTPGNTMGMGNPMPPTEEAPGSEPLCGKCKKEKKKKKVTESILDDDFGENLDEQIIENWFKEHSTSKVNIDKNLVVHSGYLRMYIDSKDPEIPSFIRFGRIGKFNLKIWMDKPVKEYILSNIPTDCNELIIDCDGITRLVIDVPSIHTDKIKIVSQGLTNVIQELVLPNKVACPDIDLSDCTLLNDLKYKTILTRLLNLPKTYAGKLLKNTLGFDEKSMNIAVSGNPLF